MSKLHEVLAVEAPLEKVARNLTAETVKTFGKDNLFKGHVKRLKMFSDSDQNLNEESFLKLETTVDENLEYLTPAIAKYWNAVLTKDATNQVAVADIKLADGTVLATEMPATFLLGLETKLGELRKMYLAIPTLAPGKDWQLNEMERAGIYRDANPEKVFKDETKTVFVEVSPATEFHPAQIQAVKNVTKIGEYTTTTECGMVTPLEKANRLSRLDDLLTSVKKARMRANNVDVVNHESVAERLLGYINKGV